MSCLFVHNSLFFALFYLQHNWKLFVTYYVISGLCLQRWMSFVDLDRGRF